MVIARAGGEGGRVFLRGTGMQSSMLMEAQVAAGGSTGEYGGWRVPVDFGDPEGEFAASRESAGVFDGSMFGRIVVTGHERLDLLHRLSTNDLLGAEVGSVLPTLFLTDKGKIVDRVIVHVREDSLLLVTSPGREEILKHWVERYTISEDVSLAIVTAVSVMNYVVGPDALTIVKQLWGAVPIPGRWISLSGSVLSVAREAGVRATDAVTVFSDAGGAKEAWHSLTRGGRGARAIGSTAFETYRITRGIPMAGGELLEGTTPYDAGLTDDISYTKGCYIGQEVIARIDTYQKVRRGLAGIRSEADLRSMRERRLFHGGKEIGTLTSLAPLLVDGESRGLCIVATGDAPAGTIVTLGDTGPGATVEALARAAGMIDQDGGSA